MPEQNLAPETFFQKTIKASPATWELATKIMVLLDLDPLDGNRVAQVAALINQSSK